MNTAEVTMAQALGRGARCKCPNCGEGELFRKFLKVNDTCPVCGEELYHQRADDMPAYVVMSIVGHIVVGLVFWTEMEYAPPYWVHAMLWGPLTIALALGLLQPVKGAIIAFQWKSGMHGFGPARHAREIAAANVHEREIAAAS